MGRLHQYLAAFASSFGSYILGIAAVWPSYSLGMYTATNTTLLAVPMTEIEASLLGSLPSLGAMLGSGLAGLIINVYGRKYGGLAMSLPFVLSWVLIDWSSTTTTLFSGRFLAGVGGGAFLVYSPIFISETAEDSVRGTLSSGPVALYCAGTIASYLMGWLCTHQIIIWFNLALSVFCCLLFIGVVESPIYLLKENKEEEAVKALAKYRGVPTSSKIVQDELSRMKMKFAPTVELVAISEDDVKLKAELDKEKQENENNVISEVSKMPTIKLLFVNPSSRRAFYTVGIVISFQIFMGIVPVQVYAKDLFSVAAPNLSSHVCSVLFAVVLFVGSLLPALLVDKAGRRILILSSSVLVFVFMTSLGYVMQTGIGPSWLAALLILLYCCAFNLGAGTIPYILLAESFPTEVQNLASTLLVEWVWLLNFVIIAIFPFMTKLFNIYGVFYIFGAFGFMNAVVSYFMVPETKGLSSEQIQTAYLKCARK